MAFVLANASRFVVDGTHATAFLKSVDMGKSLDTVDVTTLIDTVKQNLTGLASGKISVKGLFDPVPDLAFQSALTTPAVDKIVQYAPQGFTLGNQVYACAANHTDYTVGAPVADALTAELSFQANGTQRSACMTSPRRPHPRTVHRSTTQCSRPMVASPT